MQPLHSLAAAGGVVYLRDCGLIEAGQGPE